MGFCFRLCRLGAVLQLAEFLVLVSADCLLTCFCFFLCREFHNVVHRHLALDRLAHLYLVLVIVMLIKTCDKHYYDEDNIDVGNPISCGVVVNHKVELTEEEKAQARKEALKAYQEEEMRKIQQRHSKPKPTAKAAQSNQTELSLFDF